MADTQYYQKPGKMHPELDKHMLPNIERSEGIRPAGNFTVAPWLPVSGGVKDDRTREYFVILPGKVLSLTADGYVVPAGLGQKLLAAANGDTVLTYTQEDIDNRVQSIVTGSVVAATGNITKGQITTALRTRGIIATDESANDYIGNPVGVAPHPMFNSFVHSNRKHKQLSNPNDYRWHNYNLQNSVTILCDYVLELPWVPEQLGAADAISDLASIKSATASQLGLWYAEFTAASVLPVAQDTEHLPWAFSVDPLSLFDNRVAALRDIRSTGDYAVDSDLQRLYFYHGGTSTAAVGSDVGSVEVQPYHYNSTSDSHVSRNYACVVGDIKPGCFLKPTVNSNLIPVTHADYRVSFETGISTDALGTAVSQIQQAIRENALIVGQVLEIDHNPQPLVKEIRSYGEHLSFTSEYYRDKLPGSATGGQPSSVIYSKAANKVVSVNLIRH